MLSRGFRSLDAVEVTGDLRNRTFHELRSGSLIVKKSLRPLACQFR